MSIKERINLFIRTLQAIISPSSLAEWAVNNEYTKLHGNVDDYRIARREHAKIFRTSVFYSFLKACGWTVTGFISAWIIFEYTRIGVLGIRLFQACSILVIAWAVLGRVGWEIQTLEARTIVERVNVFWFRFLYTTALWLGTTSLFLGVLDT